MGKSKALVIQNWIKGSPFFQEFMVIPGIWPAINAKHHHCTGFSLHSGRRNKNPERQGYPEETGFPKKNRVEVTKLLWPGKFEMCFLLQKWMPTSSKLPNNWFFFHSQLVTAVHPRSIWDAYGKCFLPVCTLFSYAAKNLLKSFISSRSFFLIFFFCRVPRVFYI